MYKLLLVTDRDEVREAYAGIPDLNRLMFDPIAMVDTVAQAKAYLRRPGADAIAVDLSGEETAPLYQVLDQDYPYLPIARTHRRGDGLRNELTLLREALDQLHGDFSDFENDPPVTQAILQNEVLHKLLSERVANREELASRLLLTRSPLKPHRPCLLFDFEIPAGVNFLENRWNHGFERLDLALRTNFFGHLPGPLLYTTALLSPMRLRVLACPSQDLNEKEIDLLSALAHQQVLEAAAQVKDYMDLELVCTQFRALPSLDALVLPLS